MKKAVATFAGGCFWCIESAFAPLKGVIKVTSGYSGKDKENPSHKEISFKETGHKEAVQIEFNPEEISYGTLLNVFWRHIDPTDPNGQFADKGSQYKTAIFYHDRHQKDLAELSRDVLEASKKFDKKIVTEILPFKNFYPAEGHHQSYFKKNPVQFKLYEVGSGRLGFLKKIWKDEYEGYEKPKREELKKKLTKHVFDVTQNNATERAFQNEYWNHKEEGIYVDKVSGEPLFSSKDKFDSKCGWPSFTKPIDVWNTVQKEDLSHNTKRIEVRSAHSDSHLGHVFRDGPGEKKLRYCINSAAIEFIPKENMKKRGYQKLLKLFEP